MNRIALNRTALLPLGLAALLPFASANATTWTVGIDAGPSRLEAKGEDNATTNASEALRVDWWFAPSYAIEASVAHAHTGFDTPVGDFERNRNSLRIGARGQWALDDTFFVSARAGYDYSRMRSESIFIHDLGNQQVQIGFDQHHSDSGPYIGAGIGWRWNERWSSSVDVTRTFSGAAYGCNTIGNCDSSHDGHFDSATLGLAYDLD